MSELSPMECPRLPARPANAHKGTFGKVLLTGGSIGMSGSVALSACAALRSGSGLVTAVVPRSIQPQVAAIEPSLMTRALSCEIDGGLHAMAVAELTDLIPAVDAIGIGPGLGRSQTAGQMVLALLQQSFCPVVFDADALNLMAELNCLETDGRAAKCVLTPHPGEFSRLTGLSMEQISSDREATASEFAAKHDVVVVLKGQETVVTDGRRIFRNSTGNSGMATGGSGDVLTGILTSLLGQHMELMEAAALAVHVHGLAGDLAARQLSQRGMIASDLITFLPPAWLELERRQHS